MKHAVLALSLLVSACATAPAEATVLAACPPAEYATREAAEALRASEFAVADESAANALAYAMMPCLGSADPFWRDQFAYEGLTHLLRSGQVGVGTRTTLTQHAMMHMGLEGNGFAAPFSALALSELVRADRIEAYYTDEMRGRIVDRAVWYMRGIRDYRGFDEREGWRHGVAHGADLMMQIVLDPNFNETAHMIAIRDAVGAQVAPTTHFYTYGESERLMRPILFMARRGVFTEAEWTAWFEQIMQPAPLNAWSDAFSSQAGLAKRHNMTAFIQAVWINARLSESTADDVLLPGAEAALRALP